MYACGLKEQISKRTKSLSLTQMFNQEKSFINNLAICIYSKKQLDENKNRGRNGPQSYVFYK